MELTGVLLMKHSKYAGHLGVAISIGLLAVGMNALHAHHSFPAQYDANRSETVEGIVTNVAWRNPHVYFYMDVFDEKGAVSEWSFELSNISAMRGRGWSSDTLQVGDRLEVTGFRARDNSLLLNARAVKRLDDGETLLSGSAGGE
jgi:Family of unknown function (DUF6152)